MSVQIVRDYLKQWNYEDKIQEFDESSATVELAAHAVGVIPAQIAKTLSFKVDDVCVLIVAAGDAKIDNHKYKQYFHTKAKMLTPEEVIDFTGHAIGGVCPFAVRPFPGKGIPGCFHEAVRYHVPGSGKQQQCGKTHHPGAGDLFRL